MKTVTVLLIVSIYMAFCALCVYEGHWIVGSLLALLVMNAVSVKS